MSQRNREPNGRPKGAGTRMGGAPAGRAAGGQAGRRTTAAGAAKRGGYLRGELAKLMIGGAAVCALALGLQALWPNGFPVGGRQNSEAGAAEQVSEIHTEGAIRLSEIMSSNRRTIVLEGDASPDWIEIGNSSEERVSLKGYTLSKSADDARIFTFPEMELGPGEYAVVYADSRLRAEAGESLHAPFRLSAAGDTLMLFNAGGTAIDTVNIPALGSDEAYVRRDSYHWEKDTKATPGVENTEAGYALLQQPVENSPVIVTELMSTNTKSYGDENGQHSDYIELYNRSGSEVKLGGWYLTDDGENLRKWAFPEMTLGAGEYLVIHASKQDKKEDRAHLHANFALSSEGEEVLLVNEEGRIADRVKFDLLKSNIAWSLASDNTWTSALPPSPGKPNS